MLEEVYDIWLDLISEVLVETQTKPIQAWVFISMN
jgi:hypothetical protein